jgi:hypothetical protein
LEERIENYRGHIQEISKAIKSQKNKNQKISIGGLNLIRKGDKLTMLWKN